MHENSELFLRLLMSLQLFLNNRFKTASPKQANRNKTRCGECQGQGRAKGHGPPYCILRKSVPLLGPDVPILLPLPAQLCGSVQERPPIKKMIISLKINDPLVTKVGNVHLSFYAKNAVEPAPLPDLKTTLGQASRPWC